MLSFSAICVGEFPSSSKSSTRAKLHAEHRPRRRSGTTPHRHWLSTDGVGKGVIQRPISDWSFGCQHSLHSQLWKATGGWIVRERAARQRALRNARGIHAGDEKPDEPPFARDVKVLITSVVESPRPGLYLGVDTVAQPNRFRTLRQTAER